MVTGLESNSATRPLLAALEGGGTKLLCAVGHSPDQVLERTVLPTRDPTSTLRAALDFLCAASRSHGPLDAIGMAFFGPIELRRDRSSYGCMLETPKPGWSGADLIGPFTQRFAVPIALDTDVAAAALAEWRLGAGRDVASVAYVTVGTGIGAGFAPQIASSTRLLHPEAGHLPARRVPGDDFAGVCPFHGDCLEGLASGPAIRARYGCELRELPLDHAAWPLIGTYLGQLAASLALVVSVERIVIGGGVMTGGRLLPHIRAAASRCIGGYLTPLNGDANLDRYICAPQLGEHAGLAGAFVLAAAQLPQSPSIGGEGG